MQDKLQNVVDLEQNEALPSMEVTPDKPFNECLHCEYNRNGCSFANLLATDAKRTCEILQAQRILLGLTYHDVSVKTEMSEITVIRILTGKVKNPSFDSMHRLNNGLVADPNGKFPCAKQLILAAYAKENNSGEVERLKETLADEKQKVAYLKQQVADYKALLEERKGYLKLKDKWIVTFAVAFAIALLYIIITLIVDFNSPNLGMYWRDVATMISRV